ncbi:MAG: xanthine dehydrogenase family protein molybdopterin-binding subunit [Pseudomonadota bacterium]
MSGRFFGRSIKRTEDPPLVKGKGRFVDDIDLPDLLEAAFVRSPHAHARLVGIDMAQARQMPGVSAILTFDDIRAHMTMDRLPIQFRSSNLPPCTQTPLAKGEVCHVGEAIAIVLAASRYAAEDAANAVDVAFDVLPAVADPRKGVEPGAPLVRSGTKSNILTRIHQAYGDAAAAIAGAPHRLTIALKQHRGGAHPIETRGVVADFDEMRDQLTVWSSTQEPHELRAFIMEVLGLDENQVRVVLPDVGGGFGAKFLTYPEEIVVPLAARLLKRPVKWIEDRREHFTSSIQERDQYWDFEVGFDNDGRLLGVRGQMLHDQGAYTPQGVNLPYNSSTAFPGPYLLPAYDLDVLVVETNKVPAVTVRGAGYPEGAFAMERALDAIARYLQIDRADVRQRNLIKAEQIPYTTPLRSRSGGSIYYDSGDFPATMQTAMDDIDYAGFAARQQEARTQGRYRGLGIANGIKGTGRGPFESAIVRVGRSGRVSIYTGAAPMGQGINTALAQICAEELGVDPASISVIAGDTMTVPMGLGGYASRQTVTAGSSTHLAAKEVKEKALAVAGFLLQAPVEELYLADGHVMRRNAPLRSGLSLKKIAELLSGDPGYAIPGDFPPGLESYQNFSAKSLTYAMATHAVEVEVDPLTAHVQICRYIVANDCGRAVNPMMVEGQIVGGAAHGIGNALYEWMGFDDNAQPITTNFGEYLLLTATELPRIEVKMLEFPSTLNPLGVKGVGEAGCVPAAAAIISAIENALEPFGVVVGETPLLPSRLFDLLSRAQASADLPQHPASPT